MKLTADLPHLQLKKYMKLIKTVSNLIEESRRLYDEACDKGVSEKELERLEKNYQESLRLMKIINKKQS